MPSVSAQVKRERAADAAEKSLKEVAKIQKEEARLERIEARPKSCPEWCKYGEDIRHARECPNKSKKGGRRVGANGPKPQVQKLIELGVGKLIDNHCLEKVDVEMNVITPNGAVRRVKVKKPRLVLALEKLFTTGMTSKSDKASNEALDSWIRHNVGNPVSRIAGPDGKGPVKINNITLTFGAGRANIHQDV